MFFIYAVRDKTTGKLVTNLRSKFKKYWDTEKSAQNAINSAKRYYDISRFEVVKLKVEEC